MQCQVNLKDQVNLQVQVILYYMSNVEFQVNTQFQVNLKDQVNLQVQVILYYTSNVEFQVNTQFQDNLKDQVNLQVQVILYFTTLHFRVCFNLNVESRKKFKTTYFASSWSSKQLILLQCQVLDNSFHFRVKFKTQYTKGHQVGL